MSRPSWDLRIARAAELAGRYPAAAQLLQFYQQTAEAQSHLYREFESGQQDGIEERFPAFLDQVARAAPPELAQHAAALRNADAAELKALLEEGMEGLHPARSFRPADFLARAFLQPWAEAAFALPRAEAWDLTSVCPCCGREPQTAVLREEQYGARRSLVCSFCQWEWEFRRLLCPACAEDRSDKLPVFHAEEFPAVRVEACDACQTYLLAVDMTLDARAVPFVDDLAALSLHLWAGEQGYHLLAPHW
jgi:FdhE protein